MPEMPVDAGACGRMRSDANDAEGRREKEEGRRKKEEGRVQKEEERGESAEGDHGHTQRFIMTNKLRKEKYVNKIT